MGISGTKKNKKKKKIISDHPTCVLCGRPLKSDESRKIGMGPTCYKKYLKSRLHKFTLF